MSLTTDDLSKITTIVAASEQRVKRELTERIDERIDDLAAITGNGFGEVQEKLTEFRADLIDLKVKVMDTVSRGELRDLQNRVKKLEDSMSNA